MNAQLVEALTRIIEDLPPCGGGPTCPMCIATAIAEALLEPTQTPIEATIGDIPVFTPRDVQSMLSAVLKIERKDCHRVCGRMTMSDIVLLPM